MTENKRFIEFMTQNSDDGELNYGFSDIVKKEWYHTKDRKSAKEIVELLNNLHEENQRMTDKLNSLALELLNYEMVTMGKATEISEMCYYDFLKYRKEKGNPMELQE